MKLVKDKLQYLGPADLTQYFIKKYTITDSDDYVMASTNGKKGIQVDIFFSRKLSNQISTVFLPCIALCIVAFTTVLYRVQFYSKSLFHYFNIFPS